VLVGEGTSIAYLAGTVKALAEAGIRIDLMVGKGVGALAAAFGAIQAGDRLFGRSGLLKTFAKQRPWRIRAPYLAGLVCLAAAFGVFVSPALLGILLLVAMPLLAAARIVAPASVDTLYRGIQDQVASFVAALDPIYLRAMAFPLALLFGYWMVRWVLPGVFRKRESSRGLGRWLGEGFIQVTPLVGELERVLWEAVRGASVESRPKHRKDIGLRYRDLLSSSLGQHGFCELIFYALDIDTGQEVPFVLLKERWFSRMSYHGPGRGAVAADPMDLTGEASAMFFDALIASVSPPTLLPSVPLRLPLEGRYGGEVHRFTSSLLAGQSAVCDAVAAGAQQIIYVSGAPAGGDVRARSLEKLAEATVRQILEADLRWAERNSSGPAIFIVRPEKPRLGAFEFQGRVLPGGERLELSALAAHGERDVTRMFIQPVAGHTRTQTQTQTVGLNEGPEGARQVKDQPRREADSWSDGPKEL
jgi:hypothetical protein